jgi:hypothetical protein
MPAREPEETARIAQTCVQLGEKVCEQATQVQPSLNLFQTTPRRKEFSFWLYDHTCRSGEGHTLHGSPNSISSFSAALARANLGANTGISIICGEKWNSKANFRTELLHQCEECTNLCTCFKAVGHVGCMHAYDDQSADQAFMRQQKHLAKPSSVALCVDCAVWGAIDAAQKITPATPIRSLQPAGESVKTEVQV